MAKVVHLLLAAGNSVRMGQAKQLLLWGDKTLIEHQIETLLQTKQEVVVVLGGHADSILPVIELLPVKIAINTEWANGMGSSIAYGAKKIADEFPFTDGILISLVDQPLLTSAHFEKMLCLFQPENRQIIVSETASGRRGVPALFDTVYIEELKKLNGKEGAKKIIQKYDDDVKSIVKSVECGNLLEDIDTPENYQQLLKQFNTATHKRDAMHCVYR